MPLPEQSPRIGSKWDNLIKEINRKVMIIESDHNEIQVLRTIQNSKEINEILLESFLNLLTPILKKSSTLSEEIRSEGNKIYKNNDGNLYESCFLYSLSMKCSETTSDLSFAHGNRSAALMKLGFNLVARNDCEEAIQLNHPDPFKIYERLCSLSNGCVRSMRKNIAGLEKHLPRKSSKQAKDILQKYKTRLKLMENETMVDEDQLRELSLDEKAEPIVKVKQMYALEKGRFVVAQKHINMNEKIYTEIPYAFVPVHSFGVKKYFNSDCESCALANIWPFLCFECRSATYCSSFCRQSHQSIHKYECEGYKKNLFFEIGIAHLSLRVLLVGFHSLIPLLQSLNRTKYRNNPEKIYNLILSKAKESSENYFKIEDGVYKFNEYARVLSLKPNLLRNDRFPQKNFPFAYTAWMLTVYLREQTTFFQDFISNIIDLLDNSDWNLLVSALILRHIGQLITNGHAIVDFRQNVFTADALKLMLHKNQPNGSGLHLLLKSQRIFTAIFPRVSMCNHSCDPNIRNSFDGMNLTITATRNIDKDEEIFNCYGPHWKLMSYQERQDSLRLQYNFECKCLKCYELKCDEFRFNNSVQCRFCSKRLFYPDRPLKEDDNSENEEDEEAFRLRCDDCKRVHENVAMKKFFSLLAQPSESNSPVTMNHLYTTFLTAVSGLGSLDEIRFHMTEMMLHTLITNRHAINTQNANIPLNLTIELMTIKEEIYGQFSLEFIEAGFFLLDVLSILIDKSIIKTNNANHLVRGYVQKIMDSLTICSKNIQCLIRNYVLKFCYIFNENQ